MTFAVGAASLALLVIMRRVAPKLPRALSVVALSIIAVKAFDLTQHGVAVTGDVPTRTVLDRPAQMSWATPGVF